MNVIKHLVDTNTWEYNHLKAAEELMELAEVILKKVNKKGGIKEPSDQEIIDEIGDVELRVGVLAELYGDLKVFERYRDKLNKIKDLIKEGKYTGKV